MSHRESPSCNGSQQESQKLTGSPLDATPRVDALINSMPGLWVDWSSHDLSTLEILVRQLERELNAKSRESSELKAQIEKAQSDRNDWYERAQWLEARLEAKSRELEEARKDAERYRWLRNEETISKGALLVFHPAHLDAPDGAIIHDGQRIDDAIDKARATASWSGTEIQITKEQNQQSDVVDSALHHDGK